MAIIETKPAAYKSVSFLMITSGITGGRKDVLFEFPNSDKQTVEDLGLRPRAYTMTVIIPHENYLEDRDNLLRALEDGEKGPLDHPFYGKIDNIVARSYIINERLSDLGRAQLEIVFAISDDIGVPQKADNAISEADQANDALTESISDDIAEDFEVDEGLSGNFEDASLLIDDAIEVFNEVTSIATAITNEINQYAAQINEFTALVNEVIAFPQDLANSFKNVFSTINGLFSSLEDTFEVFSHPTFFNFGDNDTPIIQTTEGRVQRAQNRDVINQSMQVFALGYAYLNAAQIQFQTDVEIDSVNAVLETQYVKVISAQGVSVPGLASPLDSIRGVSPETIAAITDLRTIANKLLDDKRTEARKIVTVQTKQMPMSVIAFQYYGNTDLTDTLLELNGIKGASFIKGDIQILTV